MVEFKKLSAAKNLTFSHRKSQTKAEFEAQFQMENLNEMSGSV
jgi:hypothetical protein